LDSQSFALRNPNRHADVPARVLAQLNGNAGLIFDDHNPSPRKGNESLPYPFIYGNYSYRLDRFK
jgi:hypothetical protein